jgi:hypothetical protein
MLRVSFIADHFAGAGRHREMAGVVERLEEDMADGEDPALGNDEVPERHPPGRGPKAPRSVPFNAARPPVTSHTNSGFTLKRCPFDAFP